MKRTNFASCILTILLVIGLTMPSFAQMDNDESSAPERRKSPVAIARVKHQDTYIKVVYGQPHKRGRDIFGELVPYDKVWRTGANEATEITFTKPVMFGGKEVKTGTYTLFTIPGENEWTIILNDVLGQWGAFEYDNSKDYLRFKVPTHKLEKTVEAFTMEFSKPQDNSTTLTMKWDKTAVDIPVEF